MPAVIDLGAKSKVKGYFMQIGVLAASAGVSTDTIRFYEKRGLLRADRRANGYRDFAEGAVALVELIRTAQKLGFSLAEISQITTSLGDTGMTGQEVENLLRAKIEELENKARELLDLRDSLATRLADVCPLGLAPPPKSAHP